MREDSLKGTDLFQSNKRQCTDERVQTFGVPDQEAAGGAFKSNATNRGHMTQRSLVQMAQELRTKAPI